MKLIKMRSVVFWIVSTVSAGVCQREPCTKVIFQTLVPNFQMSRSKTLLPRQTDVGSVGPQWLTAKIRYHWSFIRSQDSRLRFRPPESDSQIVTRNGKFSVLSCRHPWFGFLIRFETKMLDAYPCRRVLWFIWSPQWWFDAVGKSKIY